MEGKELIFSPRFFPLNPKSKLGPTLTQKKIKKNWFLVKSAGPLGSARAFPGIAFEASSEARFKNLEAHFGAGRFRKTKEHLKLPRAS
jgi:hypothetical protein